MNTCCTPTSDDKLEFEGKNRTTFAVKWSATSAHLMFGSNSELRAITEVFASNNAKENLLKTKLIKTSQTS